MENESHQTAPFRPKAIPQNGLSKSHVDNRERTLNEEVFPWMD